MIMTRNIIYGLQVVRRIMKSIQSAAICRAEMLLCLVMLSAGIIPVSAAEKTFYATANASAVGGGLVAVNLGTVPTSALSAEDASVDSWKVTGSTAMLTTSHTFTYGFLAEPQDGYWFVAWYQNEQCTVQKATTASYTEDITSTSTSASSPAVLDRWALFRPVGIQNATTVSLSPTNPSASADEYTGSVSFTTTNADSQTDFQTPQFKPMAGNGTFSVESWQYADNTVTVQYRFRGKGHFGSDSNPRTRRNSASLEVTSKGGESTGKCFFSAHFPDIQISSGAGEDAGEGYNVTTAVDNKKQSNADFTVEWADDEADFTAEFADIQGGGQWKVLSISYTPQSQQNGTVHVSYEFDPQNNEGVHTAGLTLTAITGASLNLSLKAQAEKVAMYDAEVIVGTDTTRYAALSEALAAANTHTGCTLRLLRNIPNKSAADISSTMKVTTSMTIDLNSFTLSSSSLSASMPCLIELDGSDATLRITDTRIGGSLKAKGGSASEVCAIRVSRGILLLEGGTVSIENTSTDASASATALALAGGTTLQVSSGKLQATCAAGSATGIFVAHTEAGAFVMTGGEIAVSGKEAVYGIHAQCDDLTINPAKPHISLSSVKLSATAESNAYTVRTEGAVALMISSGSYTAVATDKRAYAVYSEGSVTVDGGTLQAVAATSQAGALSVIKGTGTVSAGTMTAEAATTDANGLYVAGGTKVFVRGGSFSASLTCEDIEAKATGARVAVDGELEAQGGLFSVQTAHKNCKHVSHAGLIAGIRALDNSSLLLQNADIRATSVDDNLNDVFGIFTQGTAKCLISGCNIYVNAKDHGAWGVGLRGGVSVNTTVAKADILSCKVTVSARQVAYGLSVGGVQEMNILNAEVQVANAVGNAKGISANGGYITIVNPQVTVIDGQGATAYLSNTYSAGIYNSSKSAYLQGGRISVTGNAGYSNSLMGILNEGYLTVEGNPFVEAKSAKGYATAVCNGYGDVSTEILSGKFLASDATNMSSIGSEYGDYAFLVKGGCFSHNDNLKYCLPQGYSIAELPVTSAEYQEGCRYQVLPTTDTGVEVCRTGGTGFTTLEEALEYTIRNKNRQHVICMTADYMLPEGDYTLPQNATLLVPYKTGSGKGADTPVGLTADRTNKAGTPAAFRTLTLAKGANLTVYGTIEASAQQYVQTDNTGRVNGAYGLIVLEAGSHIDLESGSALYAWGYVTGKGTIDAKRGATVLEQFELGDFKGGGVTNAMLNNGQKIFPVTHYFYQNIETSITYHAGASAVAHTGAFVDGGAMGTDTVMTIVGINGSSALFLMDAADDSENTWVRKQYDPASDRTVYTVNSGAMLGYLNINIGNVNLDSRRYILPIASNMSLVLNYGEMSLTQDSYFMPGAELTIGKEATLKIPAGKVLCLVDKEQWNTGYPKPWYVWTAAYSPTRGASVRESMKTSMASVPSARIMVSGAIEVAGSLYTTASGADICSSASAAGRVVMRTTAPATVSTKLNICTNDCGFNSSKNAYTWQFNAYNLTSARLHNQDGSYAQTAGSAKDEVWVYMAADGGAKWVKHTESGCFIKSDDGKYYVHASDMVEVKPAPASNHVYVSMTGTRNFVWDENCQWWEVSYYPTDEGYRKALKADHNGVYNCFEYDAAAGCWKRKTVSVTWSIGGKTTTTEVPYGSVPEWHGAAPQQAATASAYYTFAGWCADSPSGTFYSKATALPVATKSVTYYARFEQDKYRYTVTFRNYDGTVLQASRYESGTMPQYEHTPYRPATLTTEYEFSGWKPQLRTVTDTATYTAQYASSPRRYAVLFLNHDGTLLSRSEAEYGSVPQYKGAIPQHEADAYYSYEWEGWVPALSEVTADQVYTAVYEQKERETGYRLDIADMTPDGMTVNMNACPAFAAGTEWTLMVGDKAYTKADYEAGGRTDGTMLIPAADLTAGEEVLIEMRGADGSTESHYRCLLPLAISTPKTTDDISLDSRYRSVLYVNKGAKLTVSSDTRVSAVYVNPEAELMIIEGVTLTAERIVLRTDSLKAARLTDNGTIEADVYYGRTECAAGMPHAIAMPYDADLHHAVFSHGAEAVHGIDYKIYEYRGSRRPDVSKHDTMLISGNTLEAERGYYLSSLHDFYTEYLFPVDLGSNDGSGLVAVHDNTSAVSEQDKGWNFISSPYAYMYECLVSDTHPENAVKVNRIRDDGRSFVQYAAGAIEPALPFYCQAAADGYIDFSNDNLDYSTEKTSTQWVELCMRHSSSGVQDFVNIYSHPDKFTDSYQRGYDVVKLSLDGADALLYVAASYGDLAFAAVADSMLTAGLTLSAYCGLEGMAAISLNDNSLIERIDTLWLYDTMLGQKVNLRQEEYTYHAEQGTASARFILKAVLKDNVGSSVDAVADNSVSVWVADRHVCLSGVSEGITVRCFSVSGQLTASACYSGEVLKLPVPAAGVYIIKAGEDVRRVVVE